MMKLLIPVGNLLLDTAVKLGEVILIPYYGLGQDLTLSLIHIYIGASRGLRGAF